MERVYGGHLCYGPPIEEGYYYDMWTDGPGVSPLDFSSLEDVMKKATKEKQAFERLVVKKEDLLEMFKYNKFKVGVLGFVLCYGHGRIWFICVMLCCVVSQRLFN